MKRTSSSPRLVAVLGTALAALLSPLLLQPAQAAAPAYVALGDSYSSGTGTRSYINDGTQLPALDLGLPEPDRGGPRLRPQLPGLLGREDPRRHQHPAVRADLGDQLRLDLGRRQRRGLRRRAHRVRAAGLDEQLRRRDQHRPGLHQQHPPQPARHPLRRDPQPVAVRQGRGGRLPADLQRRGLQRLHLVLPGRGVAAQPDRRPAQLAPGLRGRRPPASPSPTPPAASSGTPSATPTSGSTACPTRSARATTPR